MATLKELWRLVCFTNFHGISRCLLHSLPTGKSPFWQKVNHHDHRTKWLLFQSELLNNQRVIQNSKIDSVNGKSTFNYYEWLAIVSWLLPCVIVYWRISESHFLQAGLHTLDPKYLSQATTNVNLRYITAWKACVCIYIHNIYIYTGWWFQPLWKIWVSSDDYSIYIYRYSIIKSFGSESIPQQLNTNVTRGLVKRAQLLWNVHNFYGTCTTAMERAQLLWNVRNFYDLFKFSNAAKSS